MDSPAITQEQLHAFHSIDREVFSRMVINLMRDPAESLLIIAAWLWLEEMGYPNIILLMTSLSDTVVDVLSKEMAMALASMHSSVADISLLPNGGLMSATSAVMSQTFSANVFHNHRFTAIAGIKNFLTTICARIFGDILQPICQVSATDETGTGQLVIPGFPHPLFGDVTITPPSQQGQNGIDDFVIVGGLWGWEPTNNTTDDDKTLFLTFPRGLPVTKDELVELFTQMYGEGSVVRVMMHGNSVYRNQQPLFARVLMKSVTLVDEVLGGNKIAEFHTNGKRFWAQKYERREQTTITPPSSPPV
ncbi:hypothetical protein LINPERHAP1_LOCUS2814 [Linum perenne]